MNKTLKIFKEYNLDYYLNCLINYNNGNNNPYHNFYHTITVVKNIYSISNSMKIDENIIRLLLIAGIFHDFDHSGGKFPDDYNITNAIIKFNQFTKESKEDNEFIESIIKCTQFPYNKEKDVSLTDYQKIIRDADVIQWLEDNYLQQVVFGLNKEFTTEDVISIKQLEGQIGFMRSIKIFTEYAQIKVNEQLEQKCQDCEYLINVLSKE